MSRVINPDRRARLEEAIHASINTGVRAQAYHSDKAPTVPSSFAEGTLVERAAGLGRHTIGCTGDDCDCRDETPEKISERAKRHAALLPSIIATDNVWAFTILEGIYLPGQRGEQLDIPGLTPPPAGRCVTHWAAGRSKPAARQRRRCHRCDDFHAKTGHDYPSLVLDQYAKAVDVLLAGMPSGTSKRDRQRARVAAEVQAWDHPRVIRAWQATGWNGAAGVRYPERRAS